MGAFDIDFGKALSLPDSGEKRGNSKLYHIFICDDGLGAYSFHTLRIQMIEDQSKKYGAVLDYLGTYLITKKAVRDVMKDYRKKREFLAVVNQKFAGYSLGHYGPFQEVIVD